MTPAGASDNQPSWGEAALVALCAIATSVAMTWPLAARMTQILPGMGEIGDPYLHAWQIPWQAHALESGAEYFQANTQWPHENTLAFLDTTIGYVPAGFIGEGLEAAVIRYNILFLFAYSLAFLGAYLLSRQLGCSPAGALVAAAAFAFAPWRAAQNGHLIVLSSGGIPLALFLLLRGYLRRKPMVVVAGSLVAAWQISVGFTLGLQFTYLLGLLAMIFLARLWTKRETDLPRRFLLGVAVGAGLFLVVTIALALPFLNVAAEYPEAANRFSEVELYSPPPSSFLVASEHNLVWGELAEELRGKLRWPEEQTLFPGIAIVTLAIGGVLSNVLPKKVRIFVLVAVLGAAILSMGVEWGPSRAVYSFLYEMAPGWRGVRTPGRLNTSTSLGLALLAGAGAQYLIRRTGGIERTGLPRAAPLAVGILLLLAVLVEGKGSIWEGVPRPAPAGLASVEPPVLNLPFDEIHDRIYTFWSIEGFPPTVNGVGAIVPEELESLRNSMQAFPDRETVDRLRELGVSSVVLHKELVPSTPWESTALSPIDGLGIERVETDELVVFDLTSGTGR